MRIILQVRFKIVLSLSIRMGCVHEARRWRYISINEKMMEERFVGITCVLIVIIFEHYET